MKIETGTENYLNARTDGLMLFAGEKCQSELADLDRKLGGALAKALSREMFRGKAGDLCVFPTHGKIKPEVLVIAGEATDVNGLRRAAYQACRKARDAGARALSIVAGDSADRAGTLAEMAVLSLYVFDRYKKRDDKKKEIATVRVLIGKGGRASREAVIRGQILGQAACYSRDLVNEPAGVVTPSHLAERAKEIAKRNRAISCNVFGPGWMKQKGMGGLLGVAQGSRQEPRFIVLQYRPGGRATKRIAIVGKGITFDSGGLSLKTADQMVTMKCDMSGAAAVLGTFTAIADLKPGVEVLGIIPTTENMPGGAAVKPGDILRMMNGKTVEVLNTDAEGRLILADALVYAEKQKPDWIIDLATLTGACVVALGDACSGLMGTDDKLKDALRTAAAEGGDRIWELPLLDEYKETIKSDLADIKNANYGRDGGAIKAGLFLREFVEKAPWAHLDIAGPAFMEKEIGFYGKGATGHGVGLLLRLCMSAGARS